MTHQVNIPDKPPATIEEFWQLYHEATDICAKRITGMLLRLRERTPFFAALAMYAQYKPTIGGTAFTDGKDIWYNPLWVVNMDREYFDGIFLHEVLHAAFLHTFRCGMRDSAVWNMAADVVVNGVIRQQSYLKLVPGALVDEKLEPYSVEEIYAILSKRSKKAKKKAQSNSKKQKCQDGQGGPGWTISQRPDSGQGNPGGQSSQGQATPDELENGYGGCMHGQPQKEGNGSEETDGKTGQGPSMNWDAILEKHWQEALNAAEAQALMSSDGQGNIPAGMGRFLAAAKEPQIDWQSQLARFMIKTPVDFGGFDRRLFHRGLYLEELNEMTVNVDICIDTSGSIGDDEMSTFYGEIIGILRTYRHINARLFYADCSLYGPYQIDRNGEMPPPKGGGGTAFEPFFRFVEEETDLTEQKVLIYLTDGYGSFPEEPEHDTLWVCVAEGLDSSKFPFGEVARLLMD